MKLNLTDMKARCEAATSGEWEVVYAHGWAIGVGVDMAKPGTVLRVFEMVGNTLRKNTPDTRAAQRKLQANAEFIADAHQGLPTCIEEIERKNQALQEIVTESGKVDINNWPAQQQICQSIAREALEAENNKHVWDVSQEDGRFWKCRQCRNVEAALNNQLRNETCKGDKNET